MTLHIHKSLVTGTSMFQAGLLALLLMSFSHPMALRAAPIVLEATTLSSSGCGPTLMGENFSLEYVSTFGGCGGRLVPVGIGPQVPLVGFLNVPDNPGRYAIASSAAYQPSLYKDVTPQYVTDNFSGYIDVNVVLSGTLQVCLAHADVYNPGSALDGGCDPEFADFGVININVAGVAFYDASGGAIGARNFLGFDGTSAAAPEPAHLGIAAGIGLLLLIICTRTGRRKHTAIPSVHTRPV